MMRSAGRMLLIAAAAVTLSACVDAPQLVKAGQVVAAMANDGKPTRIVPRPPEKRFGVMQELGSLDAEPDVEPMVNYQIARQKDRASLPAALSAASQWTFIGPNSNMGRVVDIAFHPQDANTVYIASPGGGVYKTVDGGLNWAWLSTLAYQAVNSVAIDPFNPNVIFVSTGHNAGSGSDLMAMGVYKSTDGGASFAVLPATVPTTTSTDWLRVTRIRTHPTIPNLLFASTVSVSATLNSGQVTQAETAANGGFFRSTDGGITWTKPSTVSTYDFVIDPNNPSNMIRGRYNGDIAYSRDAGATWTALQVVPSSTTANIRLRVQYAKSTPDLVYASIDQNNGELHKSIDGGLTWSLVSTPGHNSTQGFHTNQLWVSPTDENHIIVGGVDLYRSLDGGVSFAKISNWQANSQQALAGQPLTTPHADQNAIASPAGYSEAAPLVLFGSDGGLFKTIDPRNVSQTTGWTKFTNSLSFTQFVGASGRRINGVDTFIGGTQDNGSLYYLSGQSWPTFFGGDGGITAIDPVQDYRYSQYTNASVLRAFGANFGAYICVGITEAYPSGCGSNNVQQANFYAPMQMDPNNAKRLLVGANSLWVTQDATANTVAWSAIKSPNPGASNKNYISAIAVGKTDSNVVLVGHNEGQVFRSTNALSATPIWSDISAGLPAGRLVNALYVDPADGNHIYAGLTGYYGNNLWRSNDGGTTWNNISAGLPPGTIYAITRHPLAKDKLYVGTIWGSYGSDDGGSTWPVANDGPFPTQVRQLFWLDNTTLVAATFGAGMAMTSIAVSLGQLPPLSTRGGIDIDGLGKSQLVVRNGNGQMQAGRLVNNLFAFTAIGDPGVGYRILGAGDLNGNGKSDLLYQDIVAPGDFGDASAWLDFNSGQLRLLRSVKRVWDVQATGDLDGDGFGDLVWRYVVADSPDTGVSYIWFTSGAGNTSGGNVTQIRKRGGAPLDWKLLGALDLNGDGAADVVYLSPANQLRVLMATPNRTCANLVAGSVPTGFSALKFADFTGNRRGDVLIRDGAGNTKLISLNANGLTLPPYTGVPDDQNASCTSSALVVASTTTNLPAADPTWTYYASGDFDGDGIFDIVWRQPNGALTVWLMKAGGTPTVISNAGTAPAGFTPVPLQ